MTDDLPPGWASAPIACLGDWLGGGTPSKAVREYWENGTIHWVSPKDMKRLLIDSAQDQITQRAIKESATNLVPEMSVLMVTRSGILEHTFPVAVNTVAVAINQDLKALTPLNGIDPLYTAYFLKARAQDILKSCSKDGTTVSSIDSDRLAAYEVALAPTAEQGRIVSKIDELFSSIDEGERALERVQKLVDRYRQSVLKAAVTGELTRDWREKNKGMRQQPGAQDRSNQRKLREQSLSGVDIVDEVVRLCGMNLYLHGIGNGESPIKSGDALASDPGDRYNVILTNPPFGKKSSYRVIGDDGAVETEQESYERGDFKFTTSNKQLNFMQHILTIMESGGRAGVVLPDNVLFEAGSAGEGIRRRLLTQFDFHTLLRLPTGIFYKQGVKANVLFFDKHAPRADGKPNTKAMWVYDFRTNRNFTLKKNPLKPSDLDEFVSCYCAGRMDKRKESERFKRFDVTDLLKRDKLNLDIFWLKDDSLDDVDSLPPPDEIAAQIVENLQAALEAFQSVAEELQRPT